MAGSCQKSPRAVTYTISLKSSKARFSRGKARLRQTWRGSRLRRGPGLIGGVMVGLMAAKIDVSGASPSFFAINHMEAHALTPRLTNDIDFPYLALLVSGGHSQFVAVAGANDHRILGTTMDDAIGEAYDKSANLLGLPYPGGPAIEVAAANGDPTAFDLPRPLKGRPNCDFSFSGLKTAVRKLIERPDIRLEEGSTVADIAASFQAAATEVAADRTRCDWNVQEFIQKVRPSSSPVVSRRIKFSVANSKMWCKQRISILLPALESLHRQWSHGGVGRHRTL